MTIKEGILGRIKASWGLFSRLYTIAGKKKVVWWYYIYGPDGVRHRLSTGKTSKQEAHNEVTRRIADGSALPPEIQDKVSGPTVRDFGLRIWSWKGEYIQGRLQKDEHLTERHIIRQRARFLLHIVNAPRSKTLADGTVVSLEPLGDRRIVSVTMEELESLFLSQTAHLANKTVNHTYFCAKTVWDEASRLEIIAKNPFDKMSPFDDRSTRRKVLDLRSALALLDRKWWSDDILWAINLAAATSGARVAELVALKVKALGSDRAWIGSEVRGTEGVVETTKVGEAGKRYSAIPACVMDHLEKLVKGKKPDDFVFHSGKFNRHLNVNDPNIQLKEAISRYDAEAATRGEPPLPYVVFHSWRHFVVSELSSRCGENAVSLQVGHIVEGTKGTYLHQTEEHIQDCLRGLTAMFKGFA